MIEKYSEKDKKKMAALMGALVDLLVYDLEKQKDGVKMDDFVECISDFMEFNYNI